MAGSLDEYKRLFRDATVADQMKLFNLHIGIYVVVNLIWLALNLMGTIKVDPGLAMYYPVVGWGLLVVVHYWFYIRGAENLCRLREDMVESRMR
ncbi:MAG: Pr2TM family membrane protein [Methanosarcinales archaeon]|nr:Pr2TM family membrane protein [Methanosarcinales archaeon]